LRRKSRLKLVDALGGPLAGTAGNGDLGVEAFADLVGATLGFSESRMGFRELLLHRLVPVVEPLQLRLEAGDLGGLSSQLALEVAQAGREPSPLPKCPGWA
jgi:hypothetical protein